MTEHEPELNNVAPGEPHDSMLSETISYVIGLGLGLVVLAIAQMGVHLVFFLHITSGPDNTNNVLALAFGVMIVFLVMVGTIWIMAHLTANMGPSADVMNLHLQH